jgi:hypothetical protein
MSAVRSLMLGSVEFRGCNIGKDTNNLTTLRDFLGAASVTGTDVLSDYGQVTPRISRTAAEFAGWLKTFGPTAAVATLPSGRIGFHSHPIPHGAALSMMAETQDAIAEWLRTFIDLLGPIQFQPWMLHRLPVHYLHLVPPILPYTDTPFPGENSQYLMHIQSS